MKDEKEKQKHLVVKHNKLIEAKQNLTLIEAKLFSKFISCIKADDKEFIELTFSIAALLAELGMSGKDYKEIKSATRSLRAKELRIETDRKELFTGYLSDIEVDKYTGVIVITISKHLKPYLLELKEQFTNYQLENVLKLNSFYSIRLYEFLKQYENIQQRRFELADLKAMLGLEKGYNLYGNIKNRVLIPVQKELKEKTDLFFEFEEIKTGRAVTSIKFLIFKQNARWQDRLEQTKATPPAHPSKVVKKEIIPPLEPTQPTAEPQNPLVLRLLELGFNSKDAAQITARETPDFITENADILEAKYRSGQIKTSIPQFSKGFSIDYRTTTPAVEVQEAAILAEKAQSEQKQEEALELGKTARKEATRELAADYFNNATPEQLADWETWQNTPVAKGLKRTLSETALKLAYLAAKIPPAELESKLVSIAEKAGFVVDFNSSGEWLAYKQLNLF